MNSLLRKLKGISYYFHINVQRKTLNSGIPSMLILHLRTFLLGLVFTGIICSCDQGISHDSDDSKFGQDERMKWWREARFGMFIHWGLYAQAAGEWNGERIPWIGEWIMARAQIPVEEYEKLAGDFNPAKFNAEEWVRLVKQAGMKYIIITAKHHDGFAMFHSSASKYNIVDATPFSRDPLKELADACKRNGIHLGFYYSQAQDWHEPGGTYRNGTHWDPEMETAAFENYVKGKAIPQLKEILENYGDLDILWWDTPYGMTEEIAKEFKDLTDHYPRMLTNNRLYEPWPGDFSTPEGHVPPTGLDYDWEVCMPMNNTWGYKHYDNHWKTPRILIRMLVDIASKGGNLLLNVGPTEEGLIPEPSADRLKAIGKWLDKYGESIYGTIASPFHRLPWGRCTRRITKNGTTFYLHIFNWPENRVLRVPGLTAEVRSAYLLSDKRSKLTCQFLEGDLLIDIPGEAPDPICSVIAVETRGKPVIEKRLPSLNGEAIRLSAVYAEINNPSSNNHAELTGSGEKAVITNWIDPRTWMLWTFEASEAGRYIVRAKVRAPEPVKVKLGIRGMSVTAEIPYTGGDFQVIELGEAEVKESGELDLTLRPVGEFLRPYVSHEQPLWDGPDLAWLELENIKE